MANKILPFDVVLKEINPIRSFYCPKAYTNDLNSVEFQFTLIDMSAEELVGATANVVLYMRDKSFFQNTSASGVTLEGNVVKYVMKENEGNHSGIAQVQVEIVYKNPIKIFSSKKYNFEIINALETEIAVEVVVQDLTMILSDAAEYIEAAEAAEAIRLQSEIDRVVAEDIRLANDIDRPIYHYVTQAEYDALTIEEQNDPKHIYEVTDSDGEVLDELTGFIEGMQTQFDNTIAATTVDSETINARVDKSNVIHPTLKKRLDNDKSITEQSIVSLSNQLAETTTKLKGMEYNIFAFGAIGDGVISDTTALRNVIIAADVGDTVFLPSGYKYAIDDTVLIDKQINFICEGEIIYTGVRDRVALHFNRIVGKTIKIYKVSDIGVAWHGWVSDNYIGVLFENLYFCNIDIVNNVENFTVGIRCLASGGQTKGFFFNEFNITQLKNNRIQLEVYKKDANSWFNSNVFRKIAFSYEQSGTGFQTAIVDRYCIKQTFENNIIPCDTNIFYDIRFDIQSSFGGTYTAIKLERAWSWRFENYRSELVSGTNVKTIVLDCASNLMRGLVFNPVFEAFTSEDNAKVHLLNVTNPSRDYMNIYKKSGTASNTELSHLYSDIDFNKRYRQPRVGYHFIDSLYRYSLNGVTLTDADETVEEYAGTDRLVENGVKIGTSRLGVLYLKELQQGDTFTTSSYSCVIT